MNKKLAYCVLGFVLITTFLVIAIDVIKNDRFKNKGNWQWSNDWGVNGNNVAPVNPPEMPPTTTPESQIVANTFNEAVLASKRTGKPILAFFESGACKWCKKMKEEVLPNSSVKSALSKYVFVSLNTDQNRDLASKYNVKSIPAYVVMNSQQEMIQSAKGFMTVEEFTAWLSKTFDPLPTLKESTVEE